VGRVRGRRDRPTSPAARPSLAARAKPTVKRSTNLQNQTVFKKSTAQLLGVKGAAGSEDEPLWKIRLQLTKPVTWVPLIWGVLCGAAASGAFEWTPECVAKSALCMVMSGPLLTG
jgi:chlorophyll synthase